MSEISIIHVLILLFGVFISSVSQVMLKKSALQVHSSHIKEYLNPLVIMSYMIFIVATFLSIIAYKGIPLSMGPILEATSYIYITFFGVRIFREKLGIKRILSLCIIVLGILIYSILG